MREGVKLTKYGDCASCGGELLVELAIYPGDPLCFACTKTRLIQARADGGRLYQFADGFLLNIDGRGRVLRYEFVPFRL